LHAETKFSTNWIPNTKNRQKFEYQKYYQMEELCSTVTFFKLNKAEHEFATNIVNETQTHNYSEQKTIFR
jgi:hypothetical protein